MNIGVAESQAHGEHNLAAYAKAVPTEAHAYPVPHLFLRIQAQN
jgi:hypothetical protein